MGIGETNRWLALLHSKIARLLKEKQRSDRELQASKDALTRLQEKIEEQFKRQSQAIARAEGLNKRLEEQLSATQDSLKTANEIVIPGLVAANELFIDRMEAEASVLAMRQVAARKEE